MIMSMSLTDDDLRSIKDIVESSAEQLLITMGQGFNDVYEHINEIKIDLAGVKYDLSSIKQDVGTLKQDVGILKQDVLTLKHDVRTLKQDVGILKQDVLTIQQTLGRVEILQQEEVRRLDNQTAEIKNLRKSLLRA
jgi:chromosome segregation ATPase